MSRYIAPACPSCTSAPLLDSRSSRSHYFCPSCTRFFDTALRQVPYPVYSPAAALANGRSLRKPSELPSMGRSTAAQSPLRSGRRLPIEGGSAMPRDSVPRR